MPVTALDRILAARMNARIPAVVRILVGTGAILKALQTAPLLARFDDPGVLLIPYLDGLPSIGHLPWQLTVGCWIVVAAAFAVGFRTTVAGILLTVMLAAVLISDQQAYSNHLYLLSLLTALLTVARTGSAISLDARHRGEAETVAAWPLYLIRIQVSIVYLFAALSKVNAVFLSGTVVAVTLRSEGPLAIPPEWRTFEVMAAVSLLAVLTELFLAAALWLPRWRRTAFVLGLGLHGGIAIWFIPTDALVVFTLIILAPYLLFLEAPKRSAAVVWDDSCGFCASWVRLFRRLDWLHAMRFVPSSDARELDHLGVPRADADRALQVVRGRKRQQGFDAVIAVLERTPAAFLWAPLLRAPPIATVGRRLYRRVAEGRSCSLVPPVGAQASDAS